MARDLRFFYSRAWSCWRDLETEPLTEARLDLIDFRGMTAVPAILFVLLLSASLLFPVPARGQGCLGFHGDPTSFYAQVGADHQAGNTGVGFSAFANLKDRFAFGGGVTSGREHPFSDRTLDWRALFAVGLPALSKPFCLFLELEQANHHFKNAFDMTWGSYHEQWGNLGVAYGKPIGSWMGVDWSGHTAVQLILSRTVMSGSLLVIEGEEIGTTVDAWDRRAFHPGGRLLIQARRGRYGISGGIRTLPRVGSDLISFVRVAFLI